MAPEGYDMNEQHRKNAHAANGCEDHKWTFRWQVAGPSQDPFLLLDFENDGIAVLFDCGIRVWGKVKTILKVQHLLISHAHIDHLIGFDHIIRSLLGENKTLHIHGPKGITDKLASKLAGYDWDKSAEQELVLEVNAYHRGYRYREILACNHRFERTAEPVVTPCRGPIVDEPRFQIHAVPVPHGGSPCHAYVLVEKDAARIDKDRLSELGLEPGPWVGELLRNVSAQKNAGLRGPVREGDNTVDINRLAGELVRIQKGRKIVYITDTSFAAGWLNKLKSIASNADLVICESTFLHADARLAAVYHHLTSTQAATIAKKLNAGRLVLFHISNRYHPNLFQAVHEARSIFPRTDMSHVPKRNTQRNHKNR
jgi:ribonuclease Z